MIFNAIIASFVTSILVGAAAYFLEYRSLSAGILAGATVSALNIFLIAFFVMRLLSPERKIKRAGLALIFFLKFGIVAAVLFVLIVKYQINVIGLIIGITSVLISLPIAGLIFTFSTRRRKAGDGRE